MHTETGTLLDFFLREIICGRSIVYQRVQMRHIAPVPPRSHGIDQALKKKKKKKTVHVVDLHPNTGSTDGLFMSSDQHNELIMLQDHDRAEKTAPSV